MTKLERTQRECVVNMVVMESYADGESAELFMPFMSKITGGSVKEGRKRFMN